MTNSRLEAKAVSYRYRSGPQVLHDIDLRIGSGEVVGLVGESGSGKSTLGRLLAGSDVPSAGAIERDASMGPAAVQMIFQDPYAALNPRMSPLAAVGEVCRVRGGLGRAEVRQAASDLLASVGLSGDLILRRPARLSGGQCQRVSIARALAANPSVLIADEPTSSLDVSVQAQILNLLRDLQVDRRLSIVLISHDLDVIRFLADRTYVMYQGRIVESGPTATIYGSPSDPYTRRLMSTVVPVAPDDAGSAGP